MEERPSDEFDGSSTIRTTVETDELGVGLRPPTGEFHIVGVGASAGGLESLERLFTKLPTDTGSAGAGRGSVFTVWLPLAAADAAAGEAPGPEARASARTIVLVEDQPDARRMLQLLLETDGREVFTAENGLQGAELIERHHPDLAIVDLGLPVMSGYDLARRIRGNREHDGTHLVALSGYGQDSDIQAALEAGFDEHLTKPPDPDQLEQVLAGRAR